MNVRNMNFRYLMLFFLAAFAFLHIYGINKLVLNSDELHPARAIVGTDWSITHSPWPADAEREYFNNWPVQFPPLFGLLTRLNVSILGVNHTALRLWPAFFSILAALTAWFLYSKRCSRNYALLAVILLAGVSDKLIYYSKFFKHYTADVFLCTLVVLLTLNLLKNKKWLLWVLFALTTSVGLWLGFASIYVSASSFVVLFLNVIKTHSLNANLPKLSLSFLLFLLSFGFLFSFNISNAVDNDIFIKEWQMQIFNSEKITDFGYVSHYLTRVVYHILLLPYYFFLNSVIAAVIANGLIAIWVVKKFLHKNWQDLLLVLLPLGLVILASLLGKYPFSADRLSLFLLPLWIIMIVEGFVFLKNEIKKKSTLLYYTTQIALFSFILFSLFINTKRVLALDYGGGRKVDLLFQTLANQVQDEDDVFLHWGAILPFYYYFTDHGAGFKNKYAIPQSPDDSINVIYGEEHSVTNDYSDMYEQISSTQGRLWVCFCHLWPSENMINLITLLDKKKNKVTEYNFKGCKLILYENAVDQN